VTSGGIRCSKGTPIIKKVQPLPFYQRKNNERRKGRTTKKEKKNKSLDIEQIYGHGSQRGLMPGSDRAGWLPAVSYCSALKSLLIQNHDNENVRNIGQGEARHRKYKRLKLGGGQAYNHSSD
jgi:hypothetical protein